MLRIVLASRSGDPRKDPDAVLYCGHNADAAQAAIDTAPVDFIRLETTPIPHLLRAKRSRGVEAPAAQSEHLESTSDFVPSPTHQDIERAIERIEQLSEMLRQERLLTEALTARLDAKVTIEQAGPFPALALPVSDPAPEAPAPVILESQIDVPALVVAEDGPSLALGGEAPVPVPSATREFIPRKNRQ